MAGEGEIQAGLRLTVIGTEETRQKLAAVTQEQQRLTQATARGAEETRRATAAENQRTQSLARQTLEQKKAAEAEQARFRQAIAPLRQGIGFAGVAAGQLAATGLLPEGFGQILSLGGAGVGFGTAFGPAGAAIGGLLGAIVGIVAAVRRGSEKQEEAAAKLAEAAQKQIDAAGRGGAGRRDAIDERELLERRNLILEEFIKTGDDVERRA